jgi:hypothetical protein
VSGEEELENYEVDQELRLYREYRDVLPMFAYVVETERRVYLSNSVEVRQFGEEWLEVEMTDAWVWDMHRPARFVGHVRVLTTHDVNIEELKGEDASSPPQAPEIP